MCTLRQTFLRYRIKTWWRRRVVRGLGDDWLLIVVCPYVAFFFVLEIGERKLK